MTITGSELRKAARARYGKARIYVLDAEYSLVSEQVVKKAYSSFIWQMRLIGLTMWLSNKLDCDKWAWLFKAYLTVRNALSSRKNALPVGVVCYRINGDKARGHCINTIACEAEGAFEMSEVEPQPRNGMKTLTQAERDSAWLVVF